MSRSRPASNPISYHKHTNQYYVTRGGKRVYLGPDKDEALKKYHRLGLGLELVQQESTLPAEITIKELANRFIAAHRRGLRFAARPTFGVSNPRAGASATGRVLIRPTERVGFEPAVGTCPTQPFQGCSLSRSDTSPV